MSQHSEACCNIPPVVSKGYQSKGDYITVDGMNTYAVGPTTAKSGILWIYDIFGYYPQTLQGADILALAAADRPYQVFMPDFFGGEPADYSWYPPTDEDKKQKLAAFLQGPASVPKTTELVPRLVELLTKQYPNIESWGIVGFCWGGKIVSLSTTKGTPFKVAAECHPALIDPNDAKDITVPIAILASKDEDLEAINAFKENLKVDDHHVETFADQVHGWMAARGDLDNERCRAEYERGYRILLDFFHRYL